MRSTMLGVIALLSGTGAAAAQDGTKVEAVQLTVRRAPTIEGVQVFGEPGVELQLAVKVPGKPLLSVDTERSKLVKFVDDKGTDLAAGAPTGFFSWVKLSSAFRDEPTETALLDINTKTLPAAGAGRIELEAEVVLRSAKGTEKKAQKVRLAKGSKVEVGPVPLEIASVEKSNFGGSAYNVQLQSDERMDAIKEIRFVDPAGKQIEAEQMGSGSFGFGGKTTYTRSFGLPKQYDSVTIELVCYASLESVTVPVKLSIGAGLK